MCLHTLWGRKHTELTGSEHNNIIILEYCCTISRFHTLNLRQRDLQTLHLKCCWSFQLNQGALNDPSIQNSHCTYIWASEDQHHLDQQSNRVDVCSVLFWDLPSVNIIMNLRKSLLRAPFARWSVQLAFLQTLPEAEAVIIGKHQCSWRECRWEAVVWVCLCV